MRKRSEAKAERRREEERRAPDFVLDVPSDPVNEQVVLAAALASPEFRRRLIKQFPPDAFYAEPHRAVVRGLAALESRGLEYDPAVVARLNPSVDVRLLEGLVAARPDLPPNLEYHVETLSWDWSRAQFVRGPFAALVEAIQNPKETPDRLRALAHQVSEAFDGAAGAAPFLRDTREVIREMMSKLSARMAGEAIYPFGIPGLDYWENGTKNSRGEDISGTPRITPGADPGGTTIITALSGSGKTTLAGHAILGLARQKRRVLVGAWEVRAPMTMELLTTLSLKWSRTQILNGKSNRLAKDHPLTPEELVEFEEVAHRIGKWVTFVENPFRRGSARATGRVTNDDYLDILEHHVEASGCQVAFFDLFDRVLRDRTPNDEQEAIWRMLEMANRLQIHQVLVHQQLIKGEQVRKDKRPSLEGLKGSSAYVDAGALILAPHLPARWKNVVDDTMEVYALKQRFGPPFAVEFSWEPETGQISNGRTIPFEGRDFEDGDTGIGNKFIRGGARKRSSA